MAAHPIKGAKAPVKHNSNHGSSHKPKATKKMKRSKASATTSSRRRKSTKK